MLLAQTLQLWKVVEPTMGTLANRSDGWQGGTLRMLEWWLELFHYVSVVALLVNKVLRWLLSW
jgi:hypothetical protein